MVLDGIKEETQEESSNVRKRIIYLGDGIGDLCPVLRLGLEDCVLPRQGYTISTVKLFETLSLGFQMLTNTQLTLFWNFVFSSLQVSFI